MNKYGRGKEEVFMKSLKSGYRLVVFLLVSQIFFYGDVLRPNPIPLTFSG